MTARATVCIRHSPSGVGELGFELGELRDAAGVAAAGLAVAGARRRAAPAPQDSRPGGDADPDSAPGGDAGPDSAGGPGQRSSDAPDATGGSGGLPSAAGPVRVDPSLPGPGTEAYDVAATTPAAQRGAVLFQASCAQCHGPAAPMQSIGERPTLAFSTAVNADTPRNAIQMMFNGIGWHGDDTLNYMPSFIDQYDDAQIADLAAYVRATYTDRPAWSGADAMAAKLRKEDTAR